MSAAGDSGRGVVIGTAGHVDHGKTTLVGALTGIDTDRLPEEKARGISIELGFAWLDLATGPRVAFVDVPGHERFVRQMIAGASGVDAVLLVVAADEGVMPQTREHLAICQLLGIDLGAVVLTKVDLVDPEWLALVVDDVRAFVAGTFLAGAPLVAFAAHDDARRADVVACVGELAARVLSRARDDREDRPLLVPYDRVFSAPGFGTIVTGTSMAGRLVVGDEVEVWPDGVAARVRALEVHGVRVDAVGPGRRVAVNLPALDAHGRAGVLVHPDGPRPTSMIDATFLPVPGLPQPIDDGEKGLVHLGTQRVEATLTLLGPAGAGGPAQLRLAHPIVFLPGSPWIFRGFRTWPGRPELGLTLGGGHALAPSPRRRRKTAEDAAEVLGLAAAEPEPGLVAYVAARGEAGVDRRALEAALPWPRRSIRRAVDAAIDRGALVSVGPALIVAARALAPLERALVAAVDALHTADPGRAGWPEPELHSRVRPSAPAELIAATIVRLVARGLIERVSPLAGGGRSASESDPGGPGLLARAGYRPPPTADPETLDRVVATFASAGLAPPSPKDLIGPDGRPAGPIIEALVKSGRLVRVADLVFARSALADLEARTRDWFASHEWLEAQDLKSLVQGSRKYAIPLGEWLDKARVTVRVGDRRRLRG